VSSCLIATIIKLPASCMPTTPPPRGPIMAAYWNGTARTAAYGLWRHGCDDVVAIILWSHVSIHCCERDLVFFPSSMFSDAIAFFILCFVHKHGMRHSHLLFKILFPQFFQDVITHNLLHCSKGDHYFTLSHACIR